MSVTQVDLRREQEAHAATRQRLAEAIQRAERAEAALAHSKGDFGAEGAKIASPVPDIVETMRAEIRRLKRKAGER